MTLNFVEKKVKEFNGRKINMFGENLMVNSSMIKTISYHPYTGILQVLFSTGTSYVYFSVPQEIYLQLATAESIGKTFNGLVRDKFQYKKIKR